MMIYAEVLLALITISYWQFKNKLDGIYASWACMAVQTMWVVFFIIVAAYPLITVPLYHAINPFRILNKEYGWFK